MARTEFLSPLGEQIVDPPPNFLNSLMFQKSEEYWNAGSGAAGLSHISRGQKATLQLIFQKALGFYLEYGSFDQQDTFVSIGSGDYEHTVSPYVGGDPLLLPTKFFVSRDLAWAAVDEFCRTGERTPKLSWANANETNWTYGYPE